MRSAKFHCRGLWCLIITPLLLPVPPQLFSQESDDSLRVEVETAFKTLRSASPCWEFEVNGITEIDRSEVPDGDAPAGGMNGELRFPPPKEMKSNVRCLLDITNGRYRIETRGPIHTPLGWRERFSIEIFDGTQGLVLRPNVAEETGNRMVARDTIPQGMISLRLNPCIAFCWSSGMLHEMDLVGKSAPDFQTVGGTWQSHEDRIIWRCETRSIRSTWMFDRTQGCRVVGRMREYKSDSGPPTTDRLSYRTEDGRIMLDTWTRTLSRTTRVEYKLSRAVALKNISIEQFREPKDFLQPGMLLRKDQTYFEVTQGGELLPVKRLGQSPKPAPGKE